MASSTHRQVACRILTAVVILGWCTTAWAVEFAGGTGEPNDPYQIATAGQLVAMGQDANLRDKHFVLVADIDLDPNLSAGGIFREAVIALPSLSSRSGKGHFTFDGSFDGAGHAIRNCAIYAQNDASNTALFHSIGPHGCVQNLHLEEVMIVGVTANFSGYCAALTGENAGLVVGCSATGVIIAGGRIKEGGGLICRNTGVVTRCRSSCYVSGGVVGGLVGRNNAPGRIEFCSSNGAVIDSGSATASLGGRVGTNSGMVRGCSTGGYVLGDGAGGLVGANTGTVRESCNLTSTFAGQSCGGIAGFNSGTILNCYVLGSVPGDGLVGNNAGMIVSSYGTTVSQPAPDTPHRPLRVSLANDMGDIRYVYYLDPNKTDTPIESYVSAASGIPLSPLQMVQRTSFIGFDFYGDANDGTEDHWFMPDSGYPVLTWQTEHTGLTWTPDVAGLSPEQAEASLERAGFPVVAIDYDYFRPAEAGPAHQYAGTLCPKGQVAHVLPALYVPPGTAVGIVVSQGAYDFTENVGDGSEASPFQIETAGQLDGLHDRSDLWNSHFILTTDIDLSHRKYRRALIDSFGGTFNGNGHFIRGLRIQSPTSLPGPLGMFGAITASGVVHDLTLQGAILDVDLSESMIGLLGGENDGYIQRCSAYGRIGAVGSQTGGLVGLNKGQVIDSRVGGSVWVYQGSSKVGGLVGDNRGVIEGCCARGIDVCGHAQVGGLVGNNRGSLARTQACYAQGIVRGIDRVGGLLGENSSEPVGRVRFESGEVRDCYATCSVVAQGSAGGCIGYAGLFTMQQSCFFLRPADGGGPDNGLGVPLADARMREQASFSGWDFENIWMICEGRDYPRLQWEGVECR